MLTRRHLRIKVLQALYAYYTNTGIDLQAAEKNLIKSTERIYELTLWQLSFLAELVHFAAERIEENRRKFLPTYEDLHPNTKFAENLFIRKLTDNRDYQRRKHAYHIQWADHKEHIRKLYNEIRLWKDYQKYMSRPQRSFAQDKKIITSIFTEFVAEDEFLLSLYEEMNIYWANDIYIANFCVLKVIQSITENQPDDTPLPSLYNTVEKDDPDEDQKFMTTLFIKTILRSKEFEKLIEQRASNWELHRINLMDMILLKMGLAELTEFPSIPVKVTINEIIELSKIYSTPKSKIFINGVLDKLAEDLRAEGLIVKTGRGLIED